ncbi:hypothetical protein F5X68DRAFT_68780 [Plectosphaerella plurivora]|uniref:Uncharacterized protein n=1 Tax=Plectosphaerella plurivora TaxID=936078 RepID=A0A9P9ADT0_9PEZI|nr:hypothetical protein F5X68DRAFT_68780 [Plectosphaerella plurivora]
MYMTWTPDILTMPLLLISWHTHLLVDAVTGSRIIFSKFAHGHTYSLLYNTASWVTLRRKTHESFFWNKNGIQSLRSHGCSFSTSLRYSRRNNTRSFSARDDMGLFSQPLERATNLIAIYDLMP